ncbi:MAG: acetolactate decarboxylase [Deltaproteobacteria bacterium]|jgi:acetolactate decarboxylase|nr:acetolactate decarboxylase [Deltaproteobacteria bacterium]
MKPNGPRPPSPGRIYLCAPVNALVEGIYEEKIPLSQIKEHGDFGLGTFDDLDGEMVMLDGQIYQITAEGHVHQVDEHALTPFACVTHYSPSSHDELNGELSHDAFQEWLERLLPSPNIFYAIRAEGRFATMRLRSVPKQENYRPLVEVAKDQSVFTFTDIEGSLAGFFTPAFVSSLNVPGFHLHFLSADRRHGGHLLECRPTRVNVGVQMLSTLELALPLSLDYLTWDFNRNTDQDLEKVEK